MDRSPAPPVASGTGAKPHPAEPFQSQHAPGHMPRQRYRDAVLTGRADRPLLHGFEGVG